MKIKFWGVRGSLPCSGPETLRYGGNSSCVEMRCGGRRLVFDAGTGIRPLAATMTGAQDFDLLFSHFHYDHVIGLPACGPLYHPATRCRVWAGRQDVRQVLEDFMCPPRFPLRLDFFKAELDFRGFAPGDTLDILYWLHESRRDLVRQSPSRDGRTRGTFTLRSPVRPNPIGVSQVTLEAREGATLLVRGLDCLDGTPLLDIKPARCGLAGGRSA